AAEPAALLVAALDEALPGERAQRIEVQEAVADVVVADAIRELTLQGVGAGALLDLQGHEPLLDAGLEDPHLLAQRRHAGGEPCLEGLQGPDLELLDGAGAPV